MANKKFWLGMLVMVLAFGMTAVGCDDGSTDENITGKNEEDGKEITITGITGSNDWARIDLYDNSTKNIAYGSGNISNNAITFSLLGSSLKPWAGTGSYYISLQLGIADDEYSHSIENVYRYTNGKTPAELGLTYNSTKAEIYSKSPKYTISSIRSYTIQLSQFQEFSD
jgi:hypothetical protein